MKKILISAKDLKIGGIEKALINLIKYLVEHGNNVTLVLEEKTGELLKELNPNVKIIEYKPCSIFFVPIRKAINLYKRLKFIMLYKNRFDVSISFATYSKTGSFVARVGSKKSILWCHADYLALYEGDKQKVQEFFESIKYDEFSKLFFVAKSAKKSFLQVFPNQTNVYFCNNLVDSKDILKKAEEYVDLKYNPEIITFLNVGRHDEKQKKLSRIIEAAKLLKQDGCKFRIIFVGDGPDTRKYKNLIEEYKLQENIIFTGAKENPYPYFKISNCVILSSDYEGYPVVFLESYILNKPIITTDISDFEDIENGRGIVAKKDTRQIYEAMKNFVENGYQIEEKFNVNEYNMKIENILKEILY